MQNNEIQIEQIERMCSMATRPTLNKIGDDPIFNKQIIAQAHEENYKDSLDYTEEVANELLAHVNSLGAHSDEAIVNTSDVNGAKVKDALNTLQSNIDTEAQARISGDETLDTRIDNIIAQSGTSDTEVVDARQSTYYNETFTVLDNRLENIESKKAEETMITNSFHADPVAYYGNVKTIDDFQDASTWVVGNGTQSVDTANVKIGKQSLKLIETDVVTTYLSSRKNGISLDLTKLNNGEVSTDNDYIVVALFVSDVTKIVEVIINFSQDTPFASTNRKRLGISPAELVNGWNFIKKKKSAIATTGTGAWTGIQSIEAAWVSTDNAQGAYVSFQLLQLVKADHLENYPNPFQRNGVRDFAINSGEWFVGEEFGKKIVREFIKNADADSLVSVTEFEDFTASARVSCQSNTRADLFAWIIDTTNYLLVVIRDDMFRLGKVEAGVFTPIEVSYPINIGDVLTCTMQKSGSSVFAKLENQNGETKTLNLTTTLSGKGKFALNQNGSTYLSTTLSASITEIAHAHHADIAEVSKGLTVKRQAGPFIPEELNYGEYGVDTANNRIYIKKSSTEVIYFTGTVV